MSSLSVTGRQMKDTYTFKLTVEVNRSYLSLVKPHNLWILLGPSYMLSAWASALMDFAEPQWRKNTNPVNLHFYVTISYV